MGSLLGRRSPGRQTERTSAAPDAPSKDTRYSAELRERSDPPHRDTPSRGWSAPRAVPANPRPQAAHAPDATRSPGCRPSPSTSAVMLAVFLPKPLWTRESAWTPVLRPSHRQPRRCRQRPDTAGQALRGSSGCDVGKATPDSPSFPGCKVTAHRAVPKWQKMFQLTPLASRDLPSPHLVSKVF